MKHLIILSIAIISRLLAADPQSETAWPIRDQPTERPTARYIFGISRVPTDFKENIDDASEPDNDLMPPVLIKNLPQRLIPHLSYLNLAPYLKVNGLTLEAHEWILLSSPYNKESSIYYFLSQTNADLLEQIIRPGCRAGNIVQHQLTLVSTPSLGFSNNAHTMAWLKQQNHQTHARFTISNIRGQNSALQLRSKKLRSSGEIECQSTSGSHGYDYECRLYFDWKLKGKKPIQITQLLTLTANEQESVLIDCGMHGQDKRNYFIVFKIEATTLLPSSFSKIEHTPLDKIDAIYTMPPSNPQRVQPSTQPKVSTRSYRSSIHFLSHLKQTLYHHQDHPADIFSIASAELTPPAPPLKLKQLKDTPYYSSTDQVFNLTPQFDQLGLRRFKNEWLYFNSTTSNIIVHGGEKTHDRATKIIDSITPTPLMIRTTASIVAVDNLEHSNQRWDLKKIENQSPQILASHSTLGLSGNRSSCGKITPNRKTLNPKTNKMETRYDSEFEAESTITDDHQNLYSTINLSTGKIGDIQLQVRFRDRTFILKDGTPTIIELGHPSSGTRTHLLILNADIITPNGTFHRDRFKPVK